MFFEHNEIISLEQQKEINDQIDHRFLLSKFKEEMRKNNLRQLIEIWSGRLVDLEYLKDEKIYRVATKVGGLVNKIPDKNDLDYVVDTMSVHYMYIKQTYPNDSLYFGSNDWMHTGKTKVFPKKITELSTLKNFVLYQVKDFFSKRNIDWQSPTGTWNYEYDSFYIYFGDSRIPKFCPEEFRNFLLTLNSFKYPILYRKLWRYCCCNFSFRYNP